MVRKPSVAIGFDHPSRGEGLQAGTQGYAASLLQVPMLVHVRCAVSFIQG